MWSFLGTLLGGPIVNGLLDAYRARLAATNTTEHAAVDLAKQEIAAEIEARKQATIIMQVESGRWWTAAPRSIVQWSFALFVAKCVVWDNMLGMGSTDPLNGDISSWAGMVMVTWFGGRTIEKVAQIFKR